MNNHPNASYGTFKVKPAEKKAETQQETVTPASVTKLSFLTNKPRFADSPNLSANVRANFYGGKR